MDLDHKTEQKYIEFNKHMISKMVYIIMPDREREGFTYILKGIVNDVVDAWHLLIQVGDKEIKANIFDVRSAD